MANVTTPLAVLVDEVYLKRQYCAAICTAHSVSSSVTQQGSSLDYCIVGNRDLL